MSYFAGNYDIAVIGAGHAGIEAGLAAARLGLQAVVFTINLDAVGNMPCNPAIGGTAQGPSGARARRPRRRDGPRGRRLLHPVPHAQPRQGPGRALPARAGQTAAAISEHMKRLLELRAEPLSQAGRRHGDPDGGRTHQRRRDAPARRGYTACAPSSSRPEHTSTAPSSPGECVLRLRAGRPAPCAGAEPVPARPRPAHAPVQDRNARRACNARSVDFSKMEVQRGDDDPEPFSFSTREPPKNQAVCWLTWTNERTHAVIRENLHRSPLFDGSITGVGPRYCPSIEDEDRPLCRQAAPPALSGAVRPRDGRAVPAGPVHEPAGGGAACHAAHHRRAGARRNAAPGLCHRI